MARDPDISVVVLTRGDRPDELQRAIRGVREQHDVVPEFVVVWNGAGDAGPGSDGPLGDAAGDAAMHHVVLPDNVGIPAGRNAGAEVATAPLVFFLDDDAWLTDPGVLRAVCDLFAHDARLAVVSCRIVDETGATAQRHNPRIGRSTTDRSGPVTSFLGGVSIVRARAFHEVGGLPGPFFYALEETDLAWRLIDAGWTVRYAADLTIHHPRSDPSRHPSAIRHTARNRVWLAHRLLSAPLGVVYVANWSALGVARSIVSVARRRQSPRDAVADVRALYDGTTEGWRTRVGPRQPIRWRSVWMMTKLGRPPII
jgi:GT2 family glycosyltransferase